MHSVRFVRTISYRHGTLDGHEDAHCFSGVGEIHGDEMEERIHGNDDSDGLWVVVRDEFNSW